MKILILEDNGICSKYFKTVLKEFELISCSTVEQAIDEMDNAELFLVDLYLPSRSGLEFIDILRGAGNKKPVIVVTAYRYSEINLNLKKWNIQEYLRKPIRPDKLLETVKKYLK